MGQLLNFFRSRPKKDYLLALDIGTEFVKALIFKVEESDQEKDNGRSQGLIIGAGRQRQAPYHMQAGAVADIDGVVLTCQKAIERAVKMAGLKPKKTVIGISGELVKGFTTNFSCKRIKPAERIDLPELKNIIQKIQWKAFDQARRQLSWEMGRPEIEIKLINAAVADVLIDGYRVTNPLDFQGREVFLSIFNAYAPLVHWSALEGIALKLDLDLLSIISQPYALSRAVKLNSADGAVIIDVGGGTTDISLVNESGLRGTKSLALAGRAFTKRLSQQLGVDLIEAEEVKIKYTKQELSGAVCQKIRSIFKKDIEIWSNGMELALDGFFKKGNWPNQILFCGGGSLLPGLGEKLEYLGLSGVGVDGPKVRFIHSKDVVDAIDKTDQLKEVEDIPPLALVSLSLEIFKEKGVLPFVLRQAVKMMQR